MRFDFHWHTHNDDRVLFQGRRIEALLVKLISKTETIILKEILMSGELDALKASVDTANRKLDGLGAAITSEIVELAAIKEQLAHVADLSELPAIVAKVDALSGRLGEYKTNLDADDVPPAPTA